VNIQSLNISDNVQNKEDIEQNKKYFFSDCDNVENTVTT
jgi:hypothetical protein